MLSISNLSIQFGKRVLFDDVRVLQLTMTTAMVLAEQMVPEIFHFKLLLDTIFILTRN
jgi:hypothetical protein